MSLLHESNADAGSPEPSSSMRYIWRGREAVVKWLSCPVQSALKLIASMNPWVSVVALNAASRQSQRRGLGPHTSGELVFDHVKFGVSDYAASKAFFLKALEPLGVAVVSEGPPTYGVELSPKGKASLCLYQTEEKPAHLHLAFTAENRQQVEAFYRAALEAGGKDNGAPGLCPEYHANYYAAFVIGPDGHNIEVVCHEPEA
jgi:catechol 2,3-dioxygenase-like lactoylglutathione lyase family enzyme